MENLRPLNSRTTHSFREAFKALPPDVRQRAREAYRLWRDNPNLPGLRFKRVGDEVSVRIGRNYRALGILQGDTVYWYWVGKHDVYDRMIG
ncbi:hypothetical protein HYR99_02300 [Candidatus Poribacteria bacterium]|nr:hypothetical protein [Candidatus Poribacteria bacterium]